MRAYKVRPAPGDPPGKFETGTQCPEEIAGTLAAVEYLSEIGQRYGTPYRDRFPGFSGRRCRSPGEIATPERSRRHWASRASFAGMAATTHWPLRPQGQGSMVRIGAVHYNTVDEIRRLGEALLFLADTGETSRGTPSRAISRQSVPR
jgi:hypothetical protein